MSVFTGVPRQDIHRFLRAKAAWSLSVSDDEDSKLSSDSEENHEPNPAEQEVRKHACALFRCIISDRQIPTQNLVKVAESLLVHSDLLDGLLAILHDDDAVHDSVLANQAALATAYSVFLIADSRRGTNNTHPHHYVRDADYKRMRSLFIDAAVVVLEDIGNSHKTCPTRPLVEMLTEIFVGAGIVDGTSDTLLPETGESFAPRSPRYSKPEPEGDEDVGLEGTALLRDLQNAWEAEEAAKQQRAGVGRGWDLERIRKALRWSLYKIKDFYRVGAPRAECEQAAKKKVTLATKDIQANNLATKEYLDDPERSDDNEDKPNKPDSDNSGTEVRNPLSPEESKENDDEKDLPDKPNSEYCSTEERKPFWYPPNPNHVDDLNSQLIYLDLDFKNKGKTPVYRAQPDPSGQTNPRVRRRSTSTVSSRTKVADGKESSLDLSDSDSETKKGLYAGADRSKDQQRPSSQTSTTHGSPASGKRAKLSLELQPSCSGRGATPAPGDTAAGSAANPRDQQGSASSEVDRPDESHPNETGDIPLLLRTTIEVAEQYRERVDRD